MTRGKHVFLDQHLLSTTYNPGNEFIIYLQIGLFLAIRLDHFL